MFAKTEYIVRNSRNGWPHQVEEFLDKAVYEKP